MRLLGEVALAILVGFVAYLLTRQDPRHDERAGAAVSVDGRVEPRGRSHASRGEWLPPATVSAPPMLGAREAPVTVPVHEQRDSASLRNAVIEAAIKDMHRRGVDLLDCFEDADLAIAQKIRFGADVDSSRILRWRFVEIVDGHELPSSFASCAETTLGAGYEVMLSAEQRASRGTVEVTYHLPPPSSQER